MAYRVGLFVAVSFFFLACPFPVTGQETEGSDAAREINAPPLRMVASGVFEIGGVRILKKENKVEFPAMVNMDKGLLEYLIVGTSGKLHESLLRTEVEPYSLQIALLMIGLEGSKNPLVGQGDPRTPEGDPVSIQLRWHQGKQIMEARIEEWVLKGKTPMGPAQWLFTGSVVLDGIFMAQVEKSIVAVFHDPVALIDHVLPEGASDEVWFVREDKTPPVGTKLTVVIQKEPKGSAR